MTSRPTHPREVYVWTWLPGNVEPVVAGRLFAVGNRYQFVYGRSYRERRDAIPIYAPELPLRSGSIAPPGALQMASAIRDGAPDAWGRRVIVNKMFGTKSNAFHDRDTDELVFLLESGSDRIGALDFQTSASDYVPRGDSHGTLEQLLAVAQRVEENEPLTPELDQALQHGTSIGGARPKAPIVDGARKLIAKFSSSGDTYAVVKGEYIAMRLATLAGLSAAPVELVRAAGKDVLLVERFDRVAQGDDWKRLAMVSALTILELDEMQARYASYQDLAQQIRFRFVEPTKTLRELFARLTLNILVGNVDDHARNHAAFWDGSRLRLTPAYDICPQARSGEEASQAMLVDGQRRSSQIATCLAAASHFHLAEGAALAIVSHQVETIATHWLSLCDEAKLGPVDRALFWGRQFLNPFAFYGLDGAAAPVAARSAEVRSTLA